MNGLMAVLPARSSLPQNHLLRVTPIPQAATADFDFFFLRHGLLKCMDMLKLCIMNMDIITSFKRKNWNSIFSPVYCVSAKCQVPVFCSDQRTSLTRGYFKRCCKTNSTELDSFCDSQLSRVINDNQSRHGVLLTCFKFCNLVR